MRPDLSATVEAPRRTLGNFRKPLAIILAGHNGSGKSTLWVRPAWPTASGYPLINADRMMLSVLPEKRPSLLGNRAQRQERGLDASLRMAQSACGAGNGAAVPFATETVFSHWQQRGDGTFASKIDVVRNCKRLGILYLRSFVGLGDVGYRSPGSKPARPEAVTTSRAETSRAVSAHPAAIAAALPIVDAAI